MTIKTKLVAGLLGWVASISGLHLWLNFDWAAYLNELRPEAERRLNVAYIPVT